MLLFFSRRELRQGLAELVGMALAVAILGTAVLVVLNWITIYALPVLGAVAPVFLLLLGTVMLEQKVRRGGWVVIGVAVLLGCFSWPWADHKLFDERTVPQPNGGQRVWSEYYKALEDEGFSNLVVDDRGGSRSPDCEVLSTSPAPGKRVEPENILRVSLDCP